MADPVARRAALKIAHLLPEPDRLATAHQLVAWLEEPTASGQRTIALELAAEAVGVLGGRPAMPNIGEQPNWTSE